QACLGMADAYLSANRFEEVMHWAAMSLAYLDSGASAAAKALAHFLLGAAQMRSGQSLTEAEQHLTAASDLATEHHLLGMEARSCFELGNVRAMSGELELALETFLKATMLAQAAGDPFQEALGHNNAAYNALQMGKLTIAREHIEA